MFLITTAEVWISRLKVLAGDILVLRRVLEVQKEFTKIRVELMQGWFGLVVMTRLLIGGSFVLKRVNQLFITSVNFFRFTVVGSFRKGVIYHVRLRERLLI